MKTISVDESKTIMLLKGFLSIMIVALHTSIASFWYCNSGVESFLRELLVTIGSVGVPIFFVISGMLFFRDFGVWSTDLWKHKMKVRVRTLLIPYFLWILIDFVVTYVFDTSKSGRIGSVFSIESLCSFFDSAGGLRLFINRPIDWGQNILGYAIADARPFNEPLWYIRNLIIIMMLAPLVWKLLKMTKGYCLILFALLFVFRVDIPVTAFANSSTTILFFSCGAWISMNDIDFLSFCNRLKIPALVLSCLCGFLPYMFDGINAEVGTIMKLLFELCFSVFVVGISSYLVKQKHFQPSKLLSDSSFFIYACHYCLIMKLANLLLTYMLPFKSNAIFELKVLLRPAFTVGIILLIYVSMKKICPKALALLTGGR